MHLKLRLAALTALYCAVIGTCAVASQSTFAATHNINPTDLDPNATASRTGDYHIAISPVGTPVNRLFVFLPGTSGVPNMYTLILNTGVNNGYHAFGLTYPNSDEIADQCNTRADCYWGARSSIVNGYAWPYETTFPATIQSDQIVTRLQLALVHLRDDPLSSSEGWGQYLTSNGSIDWSKVTVGGHSQGGGNAAVMAKYFALHRTCYFASPPDWVNGAPAPWMSYTNITPASAQFGFSGTQDPSVQIGNLVGGASVTGIWPTLGMMGPVISVDNNSNYGTSQMLTTSTTPATPPQGTIGNPYHGLTVRDAFTPKVSGLPKFAPVWKYLCFQ